MQPAASSQQPASPVTLRAPEPDDLDFLYDLENDPNLWVVSDALPSPMSRHTLREYLRRATASLGEAGQLRLIISDDQGQPVGTLDLYDYSALHQRAGVGITVLKDARRRGHALAALRLLLPYARQHLRLHQLYCTVAESNAASVRLFEKIGFFKVGLRRDWLRADTTTGWENAVEMQFLL